MKKIMFNDRFGLTEAVIEKRKTVTRRMAKEIKIFNPQPPYYVGEVVAVAQNYREVWDHLKTTYGSSSSIARDFYRDYVLAGRIPVSNKMFVRADLMPHQIRILDVRAERLQDITEDDCLREGLIKYTKDKIVYKYDLDDGFEMFLWRDMKRTPQEAYSYLINKISGQGTWNANPWVWRIEFELIK